MPYQIIPLTITAEFGGVENRIHPTLLWDEDAIVLVDCGFIGSLPALEQELSKVGLAASQVTDLVLTHHDHDHMGAAAAFKKSYPKVNLHASAEEMPFISAREKPLRLRQAEALQEQLPPEQKAFGEAFCALLRRVEPVEIDQLLSDGDCLPWCGGCHVMASPGHSPGHISLFLEKENLVITGDAIALEEGVPVLANPQFTLDFALAEASMERLLSMDARHYLCYHGGLYAPTPSQAD